MASSPALFRPQTLAEALELLASTVDARPLSGGASLVAMMNPITRHLGWTTRLRARHVLDGQPLVVERNQRVSKLSVHRLIVARKA